MAEERRREMEGIKRKGGKRGGGGGGGFVFRPL